MPFPGVGFSSGPVFGPLQRPQGGVTPQGWPSGAPQEPLQHPMGPLTPAGPLRNPDIGTFGKGPMGPYGPQMGRPAFAAGGATPNPQMPMNLQQLLPMLQQMNLGKFGGNFGAYA